MSNQGQKYLAKQLEDQALRLGGQIRTLKSDNELLSVDRTKLQQQLLRIATGKFIPCFKYFLNLRKSYKEDEKTTARRC